MLLRTHRADQHADPTAHALRLRLPLRGRRDRPRDALPPEDSAHPWLTGDPTHGSVSRFSNSLPVPSLRLRLHRDRIRLMGRASQGVKVRRSLSTSRFAFSASASWGSAGASMGAAARAWSSGSVIPPTRAGTDDRGLSARRVRARPLAHRANGGRMRRHDRRRPIHTAHGRHCDR
jgi:hypothetical protein